MSAYFDDDSRGPLIFPGKPVEFVNAIYYHGAWKFRWYALIGMSNNCVRMERNYRTFNGDLENKSVVYKFMKCGMFIDGNKNRRRLNRIGDEIVDEASHANYHDIS